MKYGKPGIWRKIISSKITLIVILIVLILMAKGANEMKRKNDLSASRLDTIEKDYQKLDTYKTELENRINYLSTTEGIESELRTKFRAVKEGEQIAVIIDKDTESSSSSTVINNVANANDGSLWSKLLSFLGF